MIDLTGKEIGRYKILKPIGEGGMASVYLAEDQILHRQVALKMIRTSEIPPSQLEKLLERFKREAEALARLSDDPGIVTVHDYGEYENTPFLVMAYMPGGTLKHLLGKPMDYRLAVKLLLPVAEALVLAHSHNIVHRDVKPSNLLINHKGNLALADFGISKVSELDGQTLTVTGMGLGTPGYMAPEQWKGNATPRSDIYSLGVVFYEMVTGQKPYSGRTPSDVFLKQMTQSPERPRQLNPDLPASVEVFLSKVLARDPQRRFASMLDMKDALEELATKAENEIKEGDRESFKRPLMEEQAAPKIIQGDAEKKQDQKVAPVQSQQVPLLKAVEKQKQKQRSQNTGNRRPAFWKGLTAALVSMVSLGLVIFLSLGSVQDNAFAQQAEIYQMPNELSSPSPFVTHTVTIQNTATPLVSQATATLPATVTAKPERIAGVADRRIILRIGPGEYYRMLCYLDKGSNLTIVGRNSDGTWVQVALSQNATCFNINVNGKKIPLALPKEQAIWVSSASLTISGDTRLVAYVIAPPTETPIVIKTPIESENGNQDGGTVPVGIPLPNLDCGCVCFTFPCPCGVPCPTDP